MADSLAVYLRLAAASVRVNTRRPAYLAVRTASAGLIVAIEVAGVVLLLDRSGPWAAGGRPRWWCCSGWPSPANRQGPPGLPATLAWLVVPVSGAFLVLGGLAWRGGIRHYVGTGS